MNPDVQTWRTYDIEHIAILVEERPMPSPGSLGGARRYSPRALSYSKWRAAQRDVLRALVAPLQNWPCPADWTVGAAFGFGAMESAPVTARRRKDGQPDKRTVTSVLSWDLRNLEKGVRQ